MPICGLTRRRMCMKKKIALIGYGALGHIFMDAYEKYLTEHYDLAGIYTHPAPEKVGVYPFFENIDALLAARPDYVLEFAGVEAVREYGVKVLENGCNLSVLSIGALADDALYAQLRRAAEKNGCKLLLPSGGIGGFDVLRTLALFGTDKAVIRNFKAPRSLNGAPYLQGKDLPEDRETFVFRGTAREAIANFPKNVNVAVATAVAASDVDQTTVEITSVPGLTVNTHIVEAENSTMRVKMEFSSAPDPVNPKSSTVTALSVAAMLLNMASPVEFF